MPSMPASRKKKVSLECAKPPKMLTQAEAFLVPVPVLPLADLDEGLGLDVRGGRDLAVLEGARAGHQLVGRAGRVLLADGHVEHGSGQGRAGACGSRPWRCPARTRCCRSWAARPWPGSRRSGGSWPSPRRGRCPRRPWPSAGPSRRSPGRSCRWSAPASSRPPARRGRRARGAPGPADRARPPRCRSWPRSTSS